MPWLVTPRAGRLIGCDLGTITVALSTWNLTGQSYPYALQLQLTSNSYRDPIHDLSVTAFIPADPIYSSSLITITSPVSQLLAGGAVTFVVIPIDAAGMAVLDTSNQAYFGTRTHMNSDTAVSCRVSA